MEVLIDERKFDALQMEVGYAVAHAVYTALKKAGVPDDAQLEDLVAGALFHIGCVLDGSREVKGPDGPMQVFLTFRGDENDDVLVSADGGSCIHEYAHGIAEDYLVGVGAKPARPAPGTAEFGERRLNLLDVILPGALGKRRKR
jgi:hypothetical protein